jgi:hypothetical protein
MNFTHKAMKGIVYVDPVGVVADAALSEWVQHRLEFALSIPPK